VTMPVRAIRSLNSSRPFGIRFVYLHGLEI
jgi:hypothetical protein